MKFYKRIEQSQELGLIEYFYRLSNEKVVRFTPKLNCLFIDNYTWHEGVFLEEFEITESEYDLAFNNFLNQTK